MICRIMGVKILKSINYTKYKKLFLFILVMKESRRFKLDCFINKCILEGGIN